MTMLSQVTKGKIKKPTFAIIYGVAGAGKSTFCADSDSPIFLDLEDGTSELETDRFPNIETFDQCLKCIRELLTEEHAWKTFVIDSLDSLERLIFKKVCQIKGKTKIEDIGFSKGYIYALDFWEELAKLLKELRDKKNMNILLIGHAKIKSFSDPTLNENYDRYQLELHEKAAEFFRNYVDAVLFCNHEVFLSKSSDSNKARAYGEGKRIMYTQHRPGFFAKNRLGLPFELPLSWEAFDKAVKMGRPHDVEGIKKSIQEFTILLKDPEIKNRVQEATIEAGDNVVQLEKILNQLRVITNAA